MCYSRRCLWEGYMGDCKCPIHVLGRYMCNCSSDEYYESVLYMKNIKTIKKRNLKINRIKSKLLDKS